MRLPTSEHTSRPWRIHEIAHDFRLEDVWRLPVVLDADDFPRLVELVASFDPTRQAPRLVRALFLVRRKLGDVAGWDRPATGAEQARPTLRSRLPDDLRDRPRALRASATPFAPLYQTDDEFAAELANGLVHGVVHLGRVLEEPSGGYSAQMAILVKPNGRVGTAYMAAIKPFRHLVVYPSILREIERSWRAVIADGPSRPAAG